MTTILILIAFSPKRLDNPLHRSQIVAIHVPMTNVAHGNGLGRIYTLRQLRQLRFRAMSAQHRELCKTQPLALDTSPGTQ